jgi:acetyl-CoA synthetase
VRHVVVVQRRTAGDGDESFAEMVEGRDHWWHRLLDAESKHCPPEPMDAEDVLFILYTSGTTGKPKGIVHTTGGYLTHVAATTRYVFDLRDDDVFWCTADVGWVTGHSYIVYGPLVNGATVLMYEGAPDWPERDRFWKIVERHGVTILYTAPTAIRAFMKWGDHLPAQHDLSTLRLLGSVGEPINPEAWIWYHEHIGGSRCPVVDTWWQTETGGIMITPLPGITATKPGSATVPFPGVDAELVDAAGAPVAPGGGFLTLSTPWPGMARTIWGDDARYQETYWARFPGRYFAGDGAKIDEDGYWWILGRVDDVLNVAGHRIGTMEVESAMVDHPAVAEAAVVGKQHELKGQAIAAFVTLRDGYQASTELRDDLRDHVAKKIGPIARPDDVLFAPDLPKTRSGKIMRRLLQDIAEGRALGDTTTLADPAVMGRLRDQYEKADA